ncbi:cyclin-dependent kinase inhibitor 5-like [Cucurbita pepo subsp. pepo]|uniref:cyclin-dependent kinase inhibitor 5-like n=1 Tax=Cucurbita pepo subsp. pepo TaxID=3664 RepID=UPI000C9D44E5|nr:cyclin-dependent kinase inhibitor 5-like [Cucurbita pepo subsp. pepo]
MGKYMRKTKSLGKVAVMEVSQTSFGVLTRAKTLALRRLQQSPTPSPSLPSSVASGSYLQLRSRRLVFSGYESKRQKQNPKEDGCTRNPSPRVSSSLRPAMPERSVTLGRVNDEGDHTAEEAEKSVAKIAEILARGSKNEIVDLGIEEASFGENFLDYESRDRSTRESTPSSLIRNPDIIRTPSSTIRPTSSAIETNHRNRYSLNRHMPTAHEMDEFFALAEEKQQRYFIEKYNFDPVKDMPLPGCYEWEKLQP